MGEGSGLNQNSLDVPSEIQKTGDDALPEGTMQNEQEAILIYPHIQGSFCDKFQKSETFLKVDDSSFNAQYLRDKKKKLQQINLLECEKLEEQVRGANENQNEVKKSEEDLITSDKAFSLLKEGENDGLNLGEYNQSLLLLLVMLSIVFVFLLTSVCIALGLSSETYLKDNQFVAASFMSVDMTILICGVTLNSIVICAHWLTCLHHERDSLRFIVLSLLLLEMLFLQRLAFNKACLTTEELDHYSFQQDISVCQVKIHLSKASVIFATQFPLLRMFKKQAIQSIVCVFLITSQIITLSDLHGLWVFVPSLVMFNIMSMLLFKYEKQKQQNRSSTTNEEKTLPVDFELKIDLKQLNDQDKLNRGQTRQTTISNDLYKKILEDASKGVIMVQRNTKNENFDMQVTYANKISAIQLQCIGDSELIQSMKDIFVDIPQQPLQTREFYENCLHKGSKHALSEFIQSQPQTGQTISGFVNQESNGMQLKVTSLYELLRLMLDELEENKRLPEIRRKELQNIKQSSLVLINNNAKPVGKTPGNSDIQTNVIYQRFRSSSMFHRAKPSGDLIKVQPIALSKALLSDNGIVTGLETLSNQQLSSQEGRLIYGVICKSKPNFQMSNSESQLLRTPKHDDQGNSSDPICLEFFVKGISLNGQNGLVITVSDSTQRVVNQKLKELDLYKEELLHTMQHISRTPLNSIINISEILLEQCLKLYKDDYQNDQQTGIPNLEVIVENLHIIKNNGYILLHAINTVIDLSMFKSCQGKLEIHSETFSLSEVFEEIRDLYLHQIQDKGLAFVTMLSGVDIIRSDRRRIVQLLFEIIGNAIKYTQKGKVCVKVKELDKELVWIKIEDSGEGMSELLKKRLFGNRLIQYFSRERNFNRKSSAGLGLDFSRKLVGILGPLHQIFVKSEEGKGSTFKFLLFTNYDNRQNVDIAPLRMKIAQLSQSDLINGGLFTPDLPLKHKPKPKKVALKSETFTNLAFFRNSINLTSSRIINAKKDMQIPSLFAQNPYGTKAVDKIDHNLQNIGNARTSPYLERNIDSENASQPDNTTALEKIPLQIQSNKYKTLEFNEQEQYNFPLSALIHKKSGGIGASGLVGGSEFDPTFQVNLGGKSYKNGLSTQVQTQQHWSERKIPCIEITDEIKQKYLQQDSIAIQESTFIVYDQKNLRNQLESSGQGGFQVNDDVLKKGTSLGMILSEEYIQPRSLSFSPSMNYTTFVNKQTSPTWKHGKRTPQSKNSEGQKTSHLQLKCFAVDKEEQLSVVLQNSCPQVVQCQLKEQPSPHQMRFIIQRPTPQKVAISCLLENQSIEEMNTSHEVTASPSGDVFQLRNKDEVKKGDIPGFSPMLKERRMRKKSSLICRSLKIEDSLDDKFRKSFPEKCYVLGVDDSVFNLNILELIFKKVPNVEFHKAGNGKECLNKALTLKDERNAYYRLFLMDIQMPIMDGYQAHQELKNLMATGAIQKAPVFAITAYATEKLVCLGEGMEGFIEKPIKMKILLQTINELFQGKYEN